MKNILVDMHYSNLIIYCIPDNQINQNIMYSTARKTFPTNKLMPELEFCKSVDKKITSNSIEDSSYLLNNIKGQIKIKQEILQNHQIYQNTHIPIREHINKMTPYEFQTFRFDFCCWLSSIIVLLNRTPLTDYDQNVQIKLQTINTCRKNINLRYFQHQIHDLVGLAHEALEIYINQKNDPELMDITSTYNNTLGRRIRKRKRIYLRMCLSAVQYREDIVFDNIHNDLILLYSRYERELAKLKNDNKYCPYRRR